LSDEQAAAAASRAAVVSRAALLRITGFPFRAMAAA
jgi:hypothetical protein